MTRRISIPLVIDILLVDEPGLMKTLNDHPLLSRRLVRSRRLVNETIRRKIQNHLKVGDVPLPVFAAREDAARKQRQQDLKERLDGLLNEVMSIHADDIESLAGFVAGENTDVDVGVVVQRIVGRFFEPDYPATRASYDAARIVDRWPRTNPITALWLRLSGRLRKAKKLIWSLAKDDTHCIHGTSIAMHNVVATLNNMRNAVAKGEHITHSTSEDVIATYLQAPATLARSCTAELRVKGLKKALGKGTLVVFQLGKMRASSRRLARAFAQGEWNECPADGVTLKLLELVWDKAQEVARATN